MKCQECNKDLFDERNSTRAGEVKLYINGKQIRKEICPRCAIQELKETYEPMGVSS